jgi:hypothetical protein
LLEVSLGVDAVSDEVWAAADPAPVAARTATRATLVRSFIDSPG